jgi:cytochrome c-type protein NapC
MLGAGPAAAIDWSTVPAKEIVLFYPGQSSWEWNLTESSHSGGPKIRQGKQCYACHADEEAKIGSLIVSGKKLEPGPVDHPATIPVALQAAHDGERLHLRLRWPEPRPPAGKETLVTVMLDDGALKSFSVGGCWSTCHDDVRGMPSAAPDSKMTKYLTSSRSKVGRTGGGESYKSPAELEQELAAGKFAEYWQAVLGPGAAAKAVDGIVLKERQANASPSIQAAAAREGDDWVVTLSRSLAAPSKQSKTIAPGKTYTIGIAIHPGGMEHRTHDVSFERTLVLDGGDADIVAVKR